MFSSITTVLLPNRFREQRRLDVCEESEALPQHSQSFEEYEYLRNVAQELNNVGVDIYNGGDYATAMDLYKAAAKAVMAAARCKENADEVIDEESRAELIAQIVRGKEQLYQSALLSESSNDDLGSYQWSELEGDGSPMCVSEGLKIENVEGECEDGEYTNIATVMYNTGLIHMKNGDIDVAGRCFELAMECFDMITGVIRCNNGNTSAHKSLLFAAMFNNVGYMEYRNGNIASAEDNFSKALEIGKNALSQASVDCKNKMIRGYKHVGTIYYNIGVMKGRQGLEHEVIEALDCSLGLQKVALGESHPDIAIVHHMIGSVLMGIKRWGEAMNEFLESVRILRFVFGNDHQEVARELFYIAKAHEMSGEYDEALHVYEETLRIERLALGVDHAETMMTMYEIGRMYQNKGDFDRALNVYDDVLSLVKVGSDIDESSVIFLLGEMVTIYLEKGNIDAARKLYAEVSSTIELGNDDKALVDVVGLAQVKDLLVNIPAAAAA